MISGDISRGGLNAHQRLEGSRCAPISNRQSSLVVARSEKLDDFVSLGQFVDLPQYSPNRPVTENMVDERRFEVCMSLDELTPPIDLPHRALVH